MAVHQALFCSPNVAGVWEQGCDSGAAEGSLRARGLVTPIQVWGAFSRASLAEQRPPPAPTSLPGLKVGGQVSGCGGGHAAAEQFLPGDGSHTPGGRVSEWGW